MTDLMRVAIVEDNEGITDLLRAVLRSREVIVQRLDADWLLSQEAWEGVETAVIDIMLGLDITGRDVLKFLYDRFPHVHRVAITASPSLVDDDVRTWANAVLVKPFNVSELEAVI